MSRSYKHRKSAVIHIKDQNSKFGKRQASAAVRRAADVPNGRQYRKFYCSWNISDYEWTEKKYTRDEFRRKWFDTSHFNLSNGGMIHLFITEENFIIGKKHTDSISGIIKQNDYLVIPNL